MAWAEIAGGDETIVLTSTNLFAGQSADTISALISRIRAVDIGGTPNDIKVAYNVVGSGASQMDVLTPAWHTGTSVHVTQIRRSAGGESSLVGIWPDNTLPIDNSPTQIAAGTGAVRDIDVQCGNDGKIYLLWIQQLASGFEVNFDRNTFSGGNSLGTSPGDSAGIVNSTFGPDVILSAADGYDAERCRLLLDPDGTLHAFWTESNGTTKRLIHLQSPDGGSSWATSVTRDTQVILSTTPALFGYLGTGTYHRGNLFDVGYSMQGDDKLHVILVDTPAGTSVVRYTTSGTLSNPTISSASLTDGDSSGTVSKGDTLLLTFSETITIPNGVTLSTNIFTLPVIGDTFGGAGLAISLFSSSAIQIKLGESPVLTVPGTFSSATTSAGSPSGINVAGTDTRIVDSDSNPVVAATSPVDIGGTLAGSSSSSSSSSSAGGGTPDSKRGTDSICLFSRGGLSPSILGVLRLLREMALATPVGRLLAALYYLVS
jgi:hypothetical protein